MALLPSQIIPLLEHAGDKEAVWLVWHQSLHLVYVMSESVRLYHVKQKFCLI